MLQLFGEGAVLFPVDESMRMLLMITVFHLFGLFSSLASSGRRLTGKGDVSN